MGRRFRGAAVGFGAVASLLAACSAPGSAPPAAVAAPSSAVSSAPSSAPPAGTVTDGGGRRHGGRPGASPTGAAAVAWPAEVPLPSGGSPQFSGSPGQWMATEVLAGGLDEASARVTDVYRQAGYVLQSSSPGLVVLADAHHAVTVTLRGYDHTGPIATEIVVHLSVS